MKKAELKERICNIKATLTLCIPRLLKNIITFIAFLIYTIALLWILIANAIALAILYLGAALNTLTERIYNE
tara:strand:+ start:1057 stop:1272 length:216 start_codon:yes stop_codon:yes gene_type:complete